MERVENGKIPIILLSLIMVLSVLSYCPNEKQMEVVAQNKPRGNLFEMDTDLSKADASFIGEDAYDHSGFSLSDAGDVNGDGYDDILISAETNCEGSTYTGQTYLILGKASGWGMGMDLSNADASFIGEVADDHSGHSVSGAGDVNGDGYDDLIIGAYGNDEGGYRAGQTYLILGKSSGLVMDMGLSNADASFIGESAGDYSGVSVSGAGDVNGDGYDDILIGAPCYEDGGSNAGQTHLILGKSSGWAMDLNLSTADASFIGEDTRDGYRLQVSGAGDVNGDGYDDILIGTWENDEGGDRAGQTYLILGKTSGWALDTNLSNSDASFIGEELIDCSGSSVSGAGDVNGDGYDDILIGANANDEGGDAAGQTYLIFGKSSGWAMDTKLSSANASFIGENADDNSGFPVSGAGDVNGDGYDDIIIGAVPNDEGGSWAGQTYLILGKSSGWIMDMNLCNADASFIGEEVRDYSGWWVSGAGDVNADGNDDMLIGANYNEEGGNSAGQTYLILGRGIIEPLEIYSVKTYLDDSYTQEIDSAGINDDVYIELRGLDSNNNNQDKARVIVSSTFSHPIGFPILLEETGANTGIYRNSIRISTRSHPKNRLLNATIGDIVNISSYEDPEIFSLIYVCGSVTMRPFKDDTSAVEDEEYRVHYWNIGYNDVIEWIFETDSSWLNWDEDLQDLYGTPNNDDVGTCWIRLNITDGMGHFDEHYFTLEVENSPPIITTFDVNETLEDEYYEVDYNCDDEGQGETEWSFSPLNIDWLSINSTTGVLCGTPTNEDVGSNYLTILVDDGNGGLNWTEFTLTVIDVNDPPVITTEPTTSIKQGKSYNVRFNALDEDDINTYEWTMATNATFLEMDYAIGILSGVPDNDDIGTFYVNITVEDLRGGMDNLNFTLEVINVNDYPVWVKIPYDYEVNQGEIYSFQVKAFDVDFSDKITYRYESSPDVGIEIDLESGYIEWNATTDGIIPDPDYIVRVTLFASDGEVEISHRFTLIVIPNPPPLSILMIPDDYELVPSSGLHLEWDGEDDSTDLKYDLYLSENFKSTLGSSPEMLHQGDLTETRIWISDLTPGSTYYWTVIPKDQYSIGTCQEHIYCFRVNILPEINNIPTQIVKVGEEFRLSISGSDSETSKYALEYSILTAPEGMEISGNQIFWTPGVNDVGTHLIVISLFDGLEYTNKSFDITVNALEIEPEDNDDGFPIWILFVIILLIIILIGGAIGVIFFIRSRTKEEEQEDHEEGVKALDSMFPSPTENSENVDMMSER